MWQDLRASWALLVGVGFIMLGNGLQNTLLGLRATMEGFPIFTHRHNDVGLLRWYFCGLNPGPQTRATGWTYSGLCSTGLNGLDCHSGARTVCTPDYLDVDASVDRIELCRFVVVSESWLNDRAGNETRGRILSIYMVIMTLGLGGGQFLLNLSSPLNIDLFILISIIVSFGLIPMLLTARPAPAFDTARPMSLVDLYRTSPLAVVSSGLTGAAHGTMFWSGCGLCPSIDRRH